MSNPIENAGSTSSQVSSNIVAAIATVAPAPTPSQIRAIRRAVKRYIRRRDRLEHPVGKCDRAGRWYPDDSENFDPRGHRVPSRAWPWSYMVACRTVAHCAQLEGIPELESEVRKGARRLDRKEKLAKKKVQTP